MSFREISPKENKPEGDNLKRISDKEKSVLARITELKGVLTGLAFRLGEIMNNERGYLNDNGENNEGVEGGEEDNRQTVMSRRDFLKESFRTAGEIGAGVALGGAGVKFVSDALEGAGLLHEDYGVGLSDWEIGQGLEGVSGENASEINQSEELGEKEGIIREGRREANYRQLRQAIMTQYIVKNKVDLVAIKEGIKN